MVKGAGESSIAPFAGDTFALQSINQFTFSVFGTHQASQQTITAKILRVLSLNETSHSMLFPKKGPSFVVKELHLCT